MILLMQQSWSEAGQAQQKVCMLSGLALLFLGEITHVDMCVLQQYTVLAEVDYSLLVLHHGRECFVGLHSFLSSHSPIAQSCFTICMLFSVQ